MPLATFSWRTINTAEMTSWHVPKMSPQELAAWEPVLTHGGQIPSKPEWGLAIEHVAGGALLTLLAPVIPGLSAPALHWAIAVEQDGEDSLWPKINALYAEDFALAGTFRNNVADVLPGTCSKPEQLPWAAEVLHPGLVFLLEESDNRIFIQQEVCNAFWHIYSGRLRPAIA